MAAYLVAPRAPEEYVRRYHDRGHYVPPLLSPDDPFLPNPVSAALEVFSAQYGMKAWELILLLNESLALGRIGTAVPRPVMEWTPFEVVHMLRRHDFPRRFSCDETISSLLLSPYRERDNFYSNVMILNGLARLYAQCDMTLELFLAQWADWAGRWPPSHYRVLANYSSLLLPILTEAIATGVVAGAVEEPEVSQAVALAVVEEREERVEVEAALMVVRDAMQVALATQEKKVMTRILAKEAKSIALRHPHHAVSRVTRAGKRDATRGLRSATSSKPRRYHGTAAPGSL